MTDRAKIAFRKALGLLSLLVLLALPAPAADAAASRTIARSEAPQTISGAGDMELLVEGPFGLKWEAAGGPFAIKAITEGPPAKPVAGASTLGKAHGAFRARADGRYKVSIMATGPWSVTITW